MAIWVSRAGITVKPTVTYGDVHVFIPTGYTVTVKTENQSFLSIHNPTNDIVIVSRTQKYILVLDLSRASSAYTTMLLCYQLQN